MFRNGSQVFVWKHREMPAIIMVAWATAVIEAPERKRWETAGSTSFVVCKPEGCWTRRWRTLLECTVYSQWHPFFPPWGWKEGAGRRVLKFSITAFFVWFSTVGLFFSLYERPRSKKDTLASIFFKDKDARLCLLVRTCVWGKIQQELHRQSSGRQRHLRAFFHMLHSTGRANVEHSHDCV